MRRMALMVLAVLALAGCDEVRRDAFGGLIGTVGYPPISGCDVEIYDAVRFEGLQSNAGLIAVARTDSTGRFAVELDEGYLGRAMVVVARPGPTAMYRDFGATGTPDVPFDAPRRPWVAVVSEWLGGEDTVTINPITTMAFEALMRLPANEVGGGALRFDREAVLSTQSALAANFGLRSEISQELPAPPGGPLFASAQLSFLEDNDRATAYTYVCLQLAKAANVFVTASAGADDALDFYEALFRDAEDGVMDGQYFGVPEAFLNQDPTVVGLDTNGESNFFRWLATVALDTTETGYAGAARGGNFDPAPVFMLALQDEATGAVRPTRVDSLDVWNYPYSGNVEITIRGAGLRRSDVFFFRSFDDFNSAFEVNRSSVGVDGEFLFHSSNELRLRIPDFGTTTKGVAGGLQVPGGANFRRVRFELINRPEYEQIARQADYLLTDNARVTNRTEPLMVHAAIGRLDGAGGFVPATNANNVYPAAQDPDALVAGTDEVYELRARVVNPSTFDINGTTLDLAATTITQLGGAIVADQFGGALAGRAFILPGTLAFEDLSPGEVATIAFRFVFLDTAIPADLVAGAPVTLSPVLTGVSQGPGTPTVTTNDVTDFTRPVSVAPVILDQTATLATLAITAPAAAVEGDTIDVDFTFTLGSLGGTPIRDLVVESIDIFVTFDGTTTTLRLGDSFFGTPGNAELVFLSLLEEPGFARALPMTLTGITPTRTARLRIATTAGHLGALNITATATARDATTGRVSTAADTSSTTVTP